MWVMPQDHIHILFIVCSVKNKKKSIINHQYPPNIEFTICHLLLLPNCVVKITLMSTCASLLFSIYFSLHRFMFFLLFFFTFFCAMNYLQINENQCRGFVLLFVVLLLLFVYYYFLQSFQRFFWWLCTTYKYERKKNMSIIKNSGGGNALCYLWMILYGMIGLKSL